MIALFERERLRPQRHTVDGEITAVKDDLREVIGDRREGNRFACLKTLLLDVRFDGRGIACDVERRRQVWTRVSLQSRGDEDS
jgi:hypothetical protein